MTFLSMAIIFLCFIVFILMKMLRNENIKRGKLEEANKELQKVMDDVYLAKKVREHVLNNAASVDKLRDKYQRD